MCIARQEESLRQGGVPYMVGEAWIDHCCWDTNGMTETWSSGEFWR